MHIIVQCELSFETQVITDWNVRPSADSGQSSILLRRRARAVGLFRLRLDDDLLNRGALLSLFVQFCLLTHSRGITHEVGSLFQSLWFWLVINQ